jgi:hypothetical protein
MKGVAEVLRVATRMGNFTIQMLRRALKQSLLRTQPGAMRRFGLAKADGLDPEDMVRANPWLFRCGRGGPLPEGDHPLQVDRMDELHLPTCAKCTAAGGADPDCYWRIMREPIVSGWLLPVDITKMRTKYEVDGNYKGVEVFGGSCGKEVKKMTDKGAAVEVAVPKGWHACWMGIIAPLGAVLKNGDKARAKTLCQVDIVDQPSLSLANDRLVELGLPAIKVRLSHDMAQPGANDASPDAPFSMPQLFLALALMYRGCWMAKGDVSRYYHSFPVARESRWLLLFVFLDVLYQMARCTFGYKLCPYFCSAFSAEFAKWVKARGIPAAWMMDDWFTVGPTEEKANENMAGIQEVIELGGFGFEAEKRGGGQEMTFLGVLLNSLTMKLSFDKVTAKAFLEELRAHARTVELGGQVSKANCQRNAGKLEWFSQVLNEGRLHIQAWHHYAHYGEYLSDHGRARVLMDTAFWIPHLERWARGEQGCEFPILSGPELRDEPNKLYLVQGDVSGPDGMGYYWGALEDDDPQYYSRPWGDGWEFRTSHSGEMSGLLHFLEHTDLRDVVVVWITDCLAAAFSVNKGKCYEEIGLEVLSRVLRACDEKGLQLAAIWVPREENECADLLSHLSTFLCRSEVSGQVSGLGDALAGGGALTGKRPLSRAGATGDQGEALP